MTIYCPLSETLGIKATVSVLDMEDDISIYSKTPVLPWNTGVSWDNETKNLISQSNKGKKPWNTGKKWSDDLRYKIGKSRRKPVSCAGVIYDSARTAAKEIGVTRYCIMDRIKRWPDYFYID